LFEKLLDCLCSISEEHAGQYVCLVLGIIAPKCYPKI
jgi:hypothetical protein